MMYERPIPEQSICNQCADIDGCEGWDAEPQTDTDYTTWCSHFKPRDLVA
ncbi:unnamed protein product [marine sediment metagenome]|uniref:Uncharacterized protein n=1 Tax=marine sediment metagenome TaxID=412755 RepID=X1GL25_9ZZZZ